MLGDLPGSHPVLPQALLEMDRCGWVLTNAEGRRAGSAGTRARYSPNPGSLDVGLLRGLQQRLANDHRPPPNPYLADLVSKK